MKRTQDESINILKKDLDKGNNLIDYFAIIGIKQDLIFEDFLYENSIDIINNSERINPEILSKFPPFEKTTINIDENMIGHCFPNGFKLIESSTPPPSESFSFILDNNFFSINFPQKYISCLICYEPLIAYKKLYDNYKNFDLDKKFECNENEDLKYETKSQNDPSLNIYCQSVTENSNLDNSITEETNFRRNTTISLSTKIDYVENCLNIKNASSFNNDSSNVAYTTKASESLPIYKRKENRSSATVIETLPNSNTIRHNSHLTNSNSKLRNLESFRMSSRNYPTLRESVIYKNYYVPKCILLVSLYPFFIEIGKILKTIYNYTRSLKLKKPIEKVIENLIIEVPVPPRGLYSVTYQLFNEKYLLTQYPMNQLSFLSIEYEIIFINFNMDQILEIYRHVLLETRIIFFSSVLSKLTPVIQGFIALIYPFKYPFQFITILPEENFNFLESPSPYIIGINKKYEYGFFTKHNIDISDITFLVVDIDSAKLEFYSPSVNQHTPSSVKKKLMNDEIPELPRHYKNKLVMQINDYFNKIKANTKQKEDKNTFSITIRNLFFQFIVNLFQNYNNYLNYDYYTNKDISNSSIESLFRGDEFANSVSYADRPFYKKVKDTQMFGDFIFKRMIPKDSKEKMEILLFEENLIEKRNRKMFSRKVFTPFIHSNLYDIKKTYSVPRHRGFSQDEIDFFKNNPEHVKLALKHGQEIIFEKGEILITYPIFPILMTDIFFLNNIKQCIVAPDLSDELQPINVDIISKSHLGSVSLHQCEMENYIYLCWIQLWAMTFWYHDVEEKKYRFQQLLKILDKVINHEMEIFNLLFEALSKHGEDYMILKLYERLIYYRLNPSYSICTIVMKLIDKKQVLTNKGVNDVMKYVEQFNFNQEFDSNKFRIRGIKNKYDYSIFHDRVKFYTNDTCIDCQAEINLNKLSRDFQNMRRDVLWVECHNPQCKSILLPKIAVRFGTELNSYEHLKFNTSSNEGFVLYSPYFLKYNYTNGLLNEFGLKLDLDTFKIRFNAIFWGSIWYFKLKGLDFDFMLPYQYEVEQGILTKFNMANFLIKKVDKFNKEIEKKADKKNEKETFKKIKLLGENKEGSLISYPENNNGNKVDCNNFKDQVKIENKNLLNTFKTETNLKNNFELNKIQINTGNDVDNNDNLYLEIKLQEESYKDNNVDDPSADKNSKIKLKRVSFLNKNSFLVQKSSELEFVLNKQPLQSSDFHKTINPHTSIKEIQSKEEIIIIESKNSDKEIIDHLPTKVSNTQIDMDETINLNINFPYKSTGTETNQSILVPKESLINSNYLIDNSTLYDSTRILDTEISTIEMDTNRGNRKKINKLNTIKEEMMENFLSDNFKSNNSQENFGKKEKGEDVIIHGDRENTSRARSKSLNQKKLENISDQKIAEDNPESFLRENEKAPEEIKINVNELYEENKKEMEKIFKETSQNCEENPTPIQYQHTVDQNIIKMFRENTQTKLNSRNNLRNYNKSNYNIIEKSGYRSQCDMELSKMSKSLCSLMDERERYLNETTRNTFLTDEESKHSLSFNEA